MKQFLIGKVHLAKKASGSLTYVLVDDAYLLNMNQQYLNHDTYTDIITFDLSPSGTELVGEVYISADRVKENAGKFGVSASEELTRVIFHGLLHLLGFKDKSRVDKEKMRKMEDRWLREFERST